MGKRKERRLAAMNSANRRVKLDLFADPSEEAMPNSINEEVGLSQEQDHSASVPSSSYLSGHNKENPLLLLGQYSDDELDDQASKLKKYADDVDYSTGSEEIEDVVASEDLGNNKDEILEAATCKQETDQVSSPKELNANDPDALKNTFVDGEHGETEPMAQACEFEPSENQANGHATEQWKLVLHEESNQYYYWNTVTGETSWEVPAALAHDTKNTDEQSLCSDTEEKLANVIEVHTFADENVGMGIYGQFVSADGHGTSNLISRDFENMELKSAKASDGSQSIGRYCTDNLSASCSNLSGYSNLSEHTGLHYAFNNEVQNANLLKSSDCRASEDAHASQLIQYGDALLQRMEMLDRSAQLLEEYKWIRKEIDIRISDCRALASYGSSLLPFWWHIEVQLKQIESAIDKLKASTLVQTEEFSDLNSRKMAPQEGSQLEVTLKDQEPIINSEFGSGSTKNENTGNETVSQKADFQLQETEHQLEIVPESNPMPDSSFPAPTLIDNTEEDMDIEMEVDEETPSAPTSTVCPSPSEQLIQTNQPLLQYPPSVLPNESNVLSLPEEEWIPPPPPEVEPLPPPPPPEGELDTPVESSAPFPPSYTETMIYPFSDQYNVGYQIPAYGYYSTSVTEVSNDNYYGISGGAQFSDSKLPAYYEPLAPSALSEAASSVIPVESATFYDVADVSISSRPVLSDTVPPAFYVECSAVNYEDMAPISVRSSVVDLPVDSLDNYQPKTIKKSEVSTLQASSILSTAQALEASSGNDSSLNSQPPAASKNQSKVVRSKKRALAVAPTLRSNKKVSSLVDKWKAAKEELQDEEEPEDALEILERKRQREIEGWRVRQVATGEAQDNANFVPLGGDWRERVKRRSAKTGAEDGQKSTVVAEKEKKQPDLDELSRDLPSGWQAYWDDSTKQVYYGNHTTSETTWNRPTR